MNFAKFLLPMACLLAGMAVVASCSDDDNNGGSKKSRNKIAYVTDPAKVAMLRSMTDVEKSGGRLYEIDYTADYKLDKMLEAEAITFSELTGFVAKNLFDIVPSVKLPVSYGAGCSAFAATNPATGDYLMGRNFDFCHRDSTGYIPISAILVRTAPKGRKKSISLVDGYFLGLKQGFYTDGQTDLSILMALPYAPLDGINEDGFAMGVLALDGKPTRQAEPGKKRIGTSVAIRMLLDNASDVDSAIELLKKYNMDMGAFGDKGNYHYFMADAKGNYAIVEYVYPEGSDVPSVMKVLNQNDTMRYVTNFYVAPEMVATPHGYYSKHGHDRYDTLKVKLPPLNYRVTDDQAMSLLSDVSQTPKPEVLTSFTQWSAVYNMSRKSMVLSILREYGKRYNFTVEKPKK